MLKCLFNKIIGCSFTTNLKTKIMEKIKLKCAYYNQPPSDKELLVLSPNGRLLLCHYRIAYNIFTCQCKNESIKGWYWCELNYELTD